MKNKPYFVLLSLLFFSGCAKHSAMNDVQDFVSLNRVVTKTVYEKMPTPKVHATFGYGNNPEVVKAYREFSQNGAARSIQSTGFVTLPYGAYSHPIIACEPLHLCVVQLERGETVNNIELGDSVDWLISTALVGTLQEGSSQIAIKPKALNIATDLIITTNKRTYNIVSKEGENTHVTNFYYPEESLEEAAQAAHREAESPEKNEIVDASSKIDVDHLNFNYRLRGNHPLWRPLQVFDDGNKTFIRMPEVTSHVDLPVLYILHRHHMKLINYRYQQPYYVMDGLFQRAVLVSGKGHDQAKVILDNRQIVSGEN